MASFHSFHYFKNPLLLYILLLLLLASLLAPTLGLEEVEEPQPKKKTNLLASKNQTKAIKPTTTTNSIKSTNKTTISTTPKKLNSTTTTPKKLNSTTNPSNSTKKTLDLSKPTTPKNKTQLEQKLKSQSTPSPPKTQSFPILNPKTQKSKTPNILILDDEDDNEDLVSNIKDLPSKFQQTLLPDLERISVSSRAYIHQANREISEGFKPFVGKQYAPTLASLLCCVCIFLPLLLVSLVFHRFKAYFSLQKLVLFVQVYLSIYFSILSMAALLTGLEPLKFFYASSPSVYVGLQVLQTLGYVLYLVLLLMNLVLVFGTETGFGLKVLGMGQTVVGFAVGLHYYVSVFHRAVLHQGPRTNWKVHGVYATCFLVICLLGNVERRKKAYLEEGGQEGKKN